MSRGAPGTPPAEPVNRDEPIAPIDGAADLTPDWLQTVLRAAGYPVTITRLEVEPVGTGQLSVSLRARFETAETADGLPRSVVVKLPAADHGLRVFLRRAYLAEVGFYRELAATVEVDTPACYLVAATPDASSFTIVLQDMAPALPGDQIAGATVAEIGRATANLAGLHAPRWGDQSLWDSPWLEAANPEKSQLHLMFREALPQVARRLGTALSAADHATLVEVGAVLSDFFAARSNRYALIHADYRLDNLLFRPDGQVFAVDWQTLTIGLPARDLAYVIGTSLSVADRRVAEAGLVRGYWEELVKRGVTDYSPEECFDDYRLGMLHCPLIAVIGMAYGTPTERGDIMFAVMIERSCQAIRDLGSVALARQ
jgi:hypothetical protein